jgi:hypothetical protein
MYGGEKKHLMAEGNQKGQGSGRSLKGMPSVTYFLQ